MGPKKRARYVTTRKGKKGKGVGDWEKIGRLGDPMALIRRIGRRTH